jgi:hypothetical protein
MAISDPLGSNPAAFQKQTISGCSFRDFGNYSYFGVPEFADDYIQFKGGLKDLWAAF